MSDKPEWVTVEALLKKGEYPVIADLMRLGQDVNNVIFTCMKLKARIDGAVAEHTELKIDRRIMDVQGKIPKRRGNDQK